MVAVFGVARRRWARRQDKSSRERWQAEYRCRVALGDTVVVGLAMVVADVVRFALFQDDRELAWAGVDGVDYTAVGLVLAACWLGLLGVVDSRSRRILGTGTEEYRRVVSATLALFGAIAFACLALNIDPSNGYLALALPAGLAGLCINRHLWRVVARRKRAAGEYQTSLLVVGNREIVAYIATTFVTERHLGYSVVGVCTPTAAQDGATIRCGDLDVAIAGTDAAVVEAVRSSAADTVAIAPTDHLTPVALRRLIWELKTDGIDLIVAAGLIDVAAARIHSQPVAGMAMLLVDEPQYDHANAWGKRAFDVCFAVTALIAISPVLLIAAALIKATSRGPVLYRAKRIGINGYVFSMLKFRSMQVGADAQLAQLIADSGSDPMFFKLKDDPRITRVGKYLRKFSIDELPQFVNVLAGDMSVVGPRPQSDHEVVTYDDLTRRRLLVRPGVTGLWQVSGRSDLSVEDATRFDLSYVENWSMSQDLVIIGRTLLVITLNRGAY